MFAECSHVFVVSSGPRRQSIGWRKSSLDICCCGITRVAPSQSTLTRPIPEHNLSYIQYTHRPHIIHLVEFVMSRRNARLARRLLSRPLWLNCIPLTYEWLLQTSLESSKPCRIAVDPLKIISATLKLKRHHS